MRLIPPPFHLTKFRQRRDEPTPIPPSSTDPSHRRTPPSVHLPSGNRGCRGGTHPPSPGVMLRRLPIRWRHRVVTRPVGLAAPPDPGLCHPASPLPAPPSCPPVRPFRHPTGSPNPRPSTTGQRRPPDATGTPGTPDHQAPGPAPALRGIFAGVRPGGAVRGWPHEFGEFRGAVRTLNP